MSEATAPSATDALTTYLEITSTFPTDLTGPSLVELQVLHPRICRQLDREYPTDPHGPHPVTLERPQDLTVKLDARECLTTGPESTR